MCVYAGKGRTNVELREQFYLAEGVSQSMSGFRSRMLPRQSSPGGADMTTTTVYSSSAAPAKVCCTTLILS